MWIKRSTIGHRLQAEEVRQIGGAVWGLPGDVGVKREVTVEITFELRAFEESRGELADHLAGLPSRFDSYFEDHLLAARHYQIVIDSMVAGFAAIHEEGLIVAFALAPAWRRHGQTVFARLRRQEQVRAALVPTGDEFFLAHALDEHRRFAPQPTTSRSRPQRLRQSRTPATASARRPGRTSR